MIGTRWRPWLIGAAVVVVGLTVLIGTIVATQPVRGALATYTALIATANRPDLTESARLDQARRLCTAHYQRSHELRVAAEGGLVGFPRNIHKNFQAWRQGPHVWLCPMNRIGPIYQFVFEEGRWKFDGPVGTLRPRGEVVPFEETPAETPTDALPGETSAPAVH